MMPPRRGHISVLQFDFNYFYPIFFLTDLFLDFNYFIQFFLNRSVSIVVVQGIWSATLSVKSVTRHSAPGFIRIKCQNFINLSFKNIDLFACDVSDTLGKRVPQIACSPSKWTISHVLCPSSHGKGWHITSASMSYMHTKG